MEDKICEFKTNKNMDQLPIKVEEAIQKVAKKEGYVAYKIISKSISTAGGNYFGALYEVTIKGQTQDDAKETNIFVKGIVPGDHLNFLSVSEMFNVEVFFYNELAVVFDEIQNEANVPAGERYNIARSFQESIPEAIILEDLTKKGYKTGFRMDVMSIKYAELCIEQLGRLHGLSFALEKKRPKYFDQKLRSLTGPFIFNDTLKNLIKNSSYIIMECLDSDIHDRFTKFLENSWHKVQRFYSDQRYKRSLIHSDYRVNNILMKEINGVTIDVVPVDYQLLHYGCPIMDFLYFIVLATDQKFRKKHLEDLKDLYFDSITKMLKHFNIDVNSVFPRDDFEDLYNEVLGFGLHMFVHVMPFLFAVEDEVSELGKDQLGDTRIKCDNRMNVRARELVDDFIQWGVL